MGATQAKIGMSKAINGAQFENKAATNTCLKKMFCLKFFPIVGQKPWKVRLNFPMPNVSPWKGRNETPLKE